MATEEEATETLQWFRSNFSQAEKNGHISLKDFKHAAHRNCHVSIDIILIVAYAVQTQLAIRMHAVELYSSIHVLVANC